MCKRKRLKKTLLIFFGLAALFGMLFAPSFIFYPTESEPCENSVNSSAGWEFNIPTLSLPPNPSLPVSTGGEEVQPLERQAQNPASSPSLSGSQGETWEEDMADLDRQAKNYLMNQIVEQEKERQREDLTHRMRHYCIERNFRQDVIDRIPTMIELGYQTANDPRICIVTAHLESSGGGGSSNLFGILNHPAAGYSVDGQIQYYFGRISELDPTGNVWNQAFIWYDSSDPGGKATRYANGVLADVQAI